MYICICKSVTDKQIRRAALKGADNLYELREQLGVAAGCGTCTSAAQEILDQVTTSARRPVLYTPSSA